MSHSFISDRKFWAKQYFPKGIHRSGHFTREQAAMLERHGWAYEALASGKVVAMTAEEQHFVAVFQQGAKAATKHEKLWQRYLDVTNVKLPPAFSLSAGRVGAAKELKPRMALVEH